MKKYLLVFFIVAHSLVYGCATCMLMVPTSQVTLKIYLHDGKLGTSDVLWHFSDLYTQEITQQYDKNKNQILDKEELDVILKAKLDYLQPKNMLMAMKVGRGSQERYFGPDFKNFDLVIQDKRLLFSYQFDVDLQIKDQDVLAFKFEDDEAFFSFILHDVEIQSEEFYFSTNNYLYTTSILFSKTALNQAPAQENAPAQQTQVDAQNPQEQTRQEGLLQESISKIKALFEEFKEEKSPYAIALLLVFAFLYGLIHALGPGHGKTLVASYFLSHDKSYAKAFNISLAIGIVHTFSAFLLTLFIYFIVESFLAQFISNTIYYTTKISAFIIIAIALYLLFKKYKTYRDLKTSKKQTFRFSATPHAQSCGCASCKVPSDSTDLALILSAGIIPCPGTITLFIFALSLEMYMIGFVSAFVMSLGMSSIIFFSAILSVTLRRKTSQTNPNIKKYLEYASLFIILFLGICLLF